MDNRQLKIETLLYLLALILALALRLYNLGAAPLSDSEASWALQALQVARPEAMDGSLTLGPQPAYVFLTGITFALLGTSNFLARLWPAMAGALLVLSPFFFRRELGRYAALILAFGLALDTGLVAISRIAGGPAMAVGFGLLALCLWRGRQPALTGVLGGLALLSGPAIIVGALGLGLTWLIARPRPAKTDPEVDQKVPLTKDDLPFIDEQDLTPEATPSPTDRRELPTGARLVGLSAVATILIVGTLFLRYPQGLTAWFSTIPAYLDSWIEPSGIPILRSVAALVVYQPFALIFALVGLARWLASLSLGIKDKSSLLKTLWPWWLIVLALALLPPGRQVADLAWALVPLWALAALELSEYLPEGKNIHPIALGQAILVLILCGLFWNTLIATSQALPTAGIAGLDLRVAVLVGIISLGALTTVLVSLGWSWEASRGGLVWGLSAAFLVYMVSALWGATQLRPNEPQELWSPPPATGKVDLFLKTVHDLSEWQTGFTDHIVVVSEVDAPSLRWVLRDFPNLRFVSEQTQGDMPTIIITRQEGEIPALTAAYRGQDFVWWVNPAWTSALPPDLLGWLTFREAPLLKEQVILWARADVFPGGTLEPQIDPDVE